MPDLDTTQPIPTYTPLGRVALEALVWGTTLIALALAVAYMRDGKIDMKRLGR